MLNNNNTFIGQNMDINLIKLWQGVKNTKYKKQSGVTWMDLTACFTTRSRLFVFSAESELW